MFPKPTRSMMVPPFFWEHSIDATLEHLDARDRENYRSIIEPLASNFAHLVEEILQPIQHLPHHPLLMARFGTHAILSAERFVQSYFQGKERGPSSQECQLMQSSRSIASPRPRSG